MDWCHYRFRSLWTLPARPADVYRALEQAENYPHWWPQVREVRPADGRSGTVRVRSFLPYDLVFTARETRSDPVARVLEIAMSGDIEGWARWTVCPDGPGTRATYEQEVDVRKALLRRFAVPGRPLFRLNHALMMRAGQRGLRTSLRAV
ncbi:SRPBCC family protein [Streptomyces sp. NPDC003483]